MASSTSAAYLEFVRNLTPQIVFGTCFMLLRVSIDTDKLQLDWDGVKNAAALWSCGLLFIGAVLANMVRLMESISTTSEPLEIEILRIQRRKRPFLSAITELLRAAWRLNRPGIFKYLLVVSIAYAGMFVVVEMASQGAIAALKNTIRH